MAIRTHKPVLVVLDTQISLTAGSHMALLFPRSGNFEQLNGPSLISRKQFGRYQRRG